MITVLSQKFNQIIFSQIIILFILPSIVTFFKAIKSLDFREFNFLKFIRSVVFGGSP